MERRDPFRHIYVHVAVAACGLAGGSDLPTTVIPFLLRGVNLLGIPSSLNFAVMGTVILLGVLTDELLGRRVSRRGAAAPVANPASAAPSTSGAA